MLDTAAAILPLDPEKAELLHKLLDGLDRDRLLWLSGYLAGAAGNAGALSR